jgi:hypothetical protein
MSLTPNQDEQQEGMTEMTEEELTQASGGHGHHHHHHHHRDDDDGYHSDDWYRDHGYRYDDGRWYPPSY